MRQQPRYERAQDTFDSLTYANSRKVREIPIIRIMSGVRWLSAVSWAGGGALVIVRDPS